MPPVDTIYGPIEDADITTAAQAVRTICRGPQPGDSLEDLAEGRCFQINQGFLVTGPQGPAYPSTPVHGFEDHRQGFKLHIAALPQDAARMAEVVKNALQGPQCPWYKVDPIENVKKAGTQPGKFITIYTEGPVHMEAVALRVQKALHEAGFGPANTHTPGGPGQPLLGPGDQAVGGSGLMSLRYGAFCGDKRGTKVEVPGEIKAIPSEDAIWVADPHANGAADTHGWVKDNRAFPHNHPSLQARFEQVAGNLHTLLATQWQHLEAVSQQLGEERAARQEQQLPRRGARTYDPAQLNADLARQQSQQQSASGSGSNIIAVDEEPQVPLRQPGVSSPSAGDSSNAPSSRQPRRPAPVRGQGALPRDGAGPPSQQQTPPRPHIPTVSEELRAPVLSPGASSSVGVSSPGARPAPQPRRPAPVRSQQQAPTLPGNNANNQPPSLPPGKPKSTVGQMLHHPPLPSPAEINAQRARMGLGPPPPKQGSPIIPRK